jgi:hypothetical protein
MNQLGTVGPSPTGTPYPLHRRSIVYEAFDAGDEMQVIGRLQDTRPWAEDGSAVARVHDMELRVTVRIDDMTITESEAVMHTFPHTECPGIVQAFAALTGLSVARGFTREVQNRFGGPKGCTHLEQLARSLGQVVIQAIISRRALAVAQGEASDIFTGTSSPWARNTCHIWAEDGIAEQKLAAGWRPGVGPYPSPPLEDLRRSSGTA